MKVEDFCIVNSRGGKTYETLIMLQEHKVLIAEKIWLGMLYDLCWTEPILPFNKAQVNCDVNLSNLTHGALVSYKRAVLRH